MTFIGSEPIQVDFDLKHSCADCPFTRKGPHGHYGVIMSIPQYVRMMEDGQLAHTCHKTDNRFGCDGPRKFKGDRPKHCAGLLSMMSNGAIEVQDSINRRVDLGFMSIEDYRDPAAFESVAEMIQHYAPGIWAMLLYIFDNPSVYVDDHTFMTDSPPKKKWLDVRDEKLIECCECGQPASRLDHMHPYCVGQEQCEICFYGNDVIEDLIDLIVKYSPRMPEIIPSWAAYEDAV